MLQRSRTSRVAPVGLFWAALAQILLPSRDVVADDATPIEITVVGPSATRIRVALGSTFPCDSGDNRLIVNGKFAAGQVVHSATPDRCVCFQQTYEPFTDTDWSAGAMVCRPQICNSFAKKTCVPAPDPTIRLQVSSKRP